MFAGPLFDSLAELGILAAAGPRYPRPIPSIEALRAVLRTPAPSQRAAEHQLLALADWLLDAQDAGDQQPDPAITDMTHREIARTLGFADEFHFSRRFRAEFAVSPRDYRRSAQTS